MTTTTADRTRAIELAIRDLGHAMETLCDHLYWATPNREDRADIMATKDGVRDSLMTLARALNTTTEYYDIMDEEGDQ